MKRYFWYLYMKSTGSMQKRKNGELRQNKANERLSTMASFYKSMALKKVGRRYSPERQYMGESATFMKQLDTWIASEIDKRFSNISLIYIVVPIFWTDCYKELVEIIRSKDEFLASIPDEYSELRERMENTPGIEHIDMWHEQVSFLDGDSPFRPAVFIEFNTLGIEDEGLLVQRLHTQIDFGLFCTKLFPIPTKVPAIRKRRCPSLTC